MSVNKFVPASIGIDVSKKKLDLAMLSSDQNCKRYTFNNSAKGIKDLLMCLKEQRTAATVPCVIESTGNYHLQFAIMIARAGYDVKLINPLITKKYQKSSIRNAKSDEIDARRLARIGLIEPKLATFQANNNEITNKKLISYIASLEKTKQKLSASYKQLFKCRKQIGLKVDLSQTKRALASIEKQINSLTKRIINNTEDRVTEIADNTYGVSEEKLSLLMAILGSRQFANRNQLVAYVGLDVAVKKSGKWTGRQKISKRGNAYARKILFQMAWGLKQHNPIYKKYYHRLYHERNKHYTTTLIAISRKFLRYLYAQYWQEQTN